MYSAAAPSRSKRLSAYTHRPPSRFDATPGCGYDARELIARRRGEATLRPVELVAGDRGCVDADEHLAGAGLGRVDLLVRELVGIAEGVQSDGMHLGLDHCCA
jgi:hypothetical protein